MGYPPVAGRCRFIANALKFARRRRVLVAIRGCIRRTTERKLRIARRAKAWTRLHSKIFKPFEQEDRTIARRYGGTGLGMAITSALVDLMGGEIVVDTELGRGSTFSAYIPLRLATPEQAEEIRLKEQTLETAPDSIASSFTYQFDGKRFLLAEDNEINAMIVVELLARRGAAVDRAENGQAVVDRFRSMPAGTYDAILMDIQMPVLNGWERQSKRALECEDAAAIPIIALSANDYTEDVERSRKAGMNGHVGKPIDLNVLKAQLAAATAEAAYRGNE
ncbi:MAG: response regulator [Collinsella sp.]